MGIAKELRYQKLNRASFDRPTPFPAPRSQPYAAPPLPVQPKTSKAKVRRWMEANWERYDGPTEIVEGFAATYPEFAHWLDDRNHWIWDLAVDTEP